MNLLFTLFRKRNMHKKPITEGFLEVTMVQKCYFRKFIYYGISLPESLTRLPKVIIHLPLSLPLLPITLLHLLITILNSILSLFFLQLTLLFVKSTLLGIRITLPDLRGIGRSFPTTLREVKTFGIEDKASFDFLNEALYKISLCNNLHSGSLSALLARRQDKGF